MGHYTDILLSSATRTRNYAQMLTEGITAANAGRKPKSASGGLIDTNHPLFVYGHLGVYPARIFVLTGGDPASVQAPEAWVSLFKAGAPCVDDGEGKTYPAWGEVLAHYRKATDASLAYLATLHDAVLLAQTPDPKTRETFPTVGAVINFLINNHPMVHLGQVSAWRRCMGMPSAM